MSVYQVKVVISNTYDVEVSANSIEEVKKKSIAIATGERRLDYFSDSDCTIEIEEEVPLSPVRDAVFELLSIGAENGVDYTYMTPLEMAEDIEPMILAYEHCEDLEPEQYVGYVEDWIGQRLDPKKRG